MKTLKLFFAVVAVALLFSQCRYDFIVQEDIPDPDDPNAEQVSFASQIVPIFENKCTACHDTGGQMPDLTAANAYSSINTSRYINDDAPASSLIYTKPDPDGSGSHPKYSDTEAALVLTWITQGAKDN